MVKKISFAGMAALVAALLSVCSLNAQDLPARHLPAATSAVKLGVTPALRDLTPHQLPGQAPDKTWSKRNYFFANTLKNPDALPQSGDPLVKKHHAAEANGPEVVPGLNLEGLSEEFITPPDPVGDVGLNHYMQMINSSGGALFQIWDKQGQSVYGPALTSTIWDQVGSGSIGDPIINYDHDAQRWVMMEMQGFGENQLLIAISENSDPTGSWTAWRIQTMGFPDYPKLYIWPDAYYITVNEIVGTNQCAGYALNRQAMLAGDENIATFRFNLPNYLAIRYQPATGVDWESGPPPPPGTPGMIFRVYDDAWDGGADQLQLWQIFLDWNNPDNNYAFGPTSFPTAPFETKVCFGQGLFDCIEQPGHPNVTRITALENIIMFRAPYRNFGSHESIVLNHITDVSTQVGEGGDAAMRWYELRRDAGNLDWYIYQQGTYAPDQNNRFMGTLAMDAQGNIGAGYSVASELTYPGLRITGRRVSDPPGDFPVQEYTLVPGATSHTFTNRWGDYSSMSVDPVDGKTFWFTGEYQPAGKPWGTRIGTFQIRRDTYDITPEAIVAPVSAAGLNNAQVSVRILNGGLEPAGNWQVDLYVDGVLETTETVSGTLNPGATLVHTFQPGITWTNIGQTKQIQVITRWNQDQFARNDTIRANVVKLTAFNAALPGVADLPNLICTEDYNLRLLLRNASGLPLDSAEVHWKINNQPLNIVSWQGHLEPGMQDTLSIPLSNLSGTQSLFKAQVYFPNGQMDQDTTNDKISQKLYTNLNGAFLTAEATTDLGVLNYEIRLANNDLLDKGNFTAGVQSREICSSNNTCYKIELRSTTFKWEGDFKLFDLFGNLLVQINNASPQAQTFSFCTPNRKNKDVGAVALVTPATGPGLGANEPVQISIRNFGLQNADNVEVSWRMSGGLWTSAPFPGAVAPGATASFAFNGAGANLSTPGADYLLEIKATMPDDEDTDNDSRPAPVRHQAPRDLSITQLRSNACHRPDDIQIAFQVQNKGVARVDSFSIDYLLNGVPGSYFFTQTFLEPGQSSPFFVEINSGLTGSNLLEVSVASVNGLPADDYLPDNQQVLDFDIQTNGVPVDLYVTLDDAPQETSWALYSAAGDIVAERSGYLPGELADFERFCLQNDSCYYFRLYDSGGNGLDGPVLLNNYLNSTPIWYYNPAAETFNDSTGTPVFCVNTPCSAFSPNFQITPPSSANSSDGAIVVTVTGGVPPYVYSINGQAPGASNTFTGLTAGPYVLTVSDAGSCLGAYPVNLQTSGWSDIVIARPLSVSPNPTTGLVWLSMPALEGEQEVNASISDAKGRFYRTITLTKFDQTLRGAFSLEKAASGAYFIAIYGKDGRVLAQKQIQKI